MLLPTFAEKEIYFLLTAIVYIKMYNNDNLYM